MFVYLAQQQSIVLKSLTVFVIQPIFIAASLSKFSLCRKKGNYMKALLLSDLHIEAKTRWSKSDTNEDLNFLIEQLNTLPKETFDVDCIIVSGDTTDRPRENATVISNLQKLFKAVNPFDKPVYVINGNHDAGTDNYLTAICNSIRVEEGMVQIADKKVAFLDYTNNLDYVRTYLKHEEPDIFVIHQSSQPFISLDIEDLPVLKVEDYPLHKICIVGDTHIPAVYNDENGRFIVSPGSLYPHNKTEVLHSANYLMTLDTANPDDPIKAIPLKKRSGIALESSKDLESINLSVEKQLASESPLKPIIWLPDYVKEQYLHDDRAVFVFYNTYQDSNGNVADVEDTTDVEQILNTLINQIEADDKTKQATYSLVKQYIDTDDPKDVVLE
jgi:DNA repair exonuclease SbcCD nuclease subunit